MRNLYEIGAVGGGRLYTAARPRGGDWLADDLQAWRAAGVEIIASALTDPEIIELGLAEEEARWRAEGGVFIRCPIPDFSTPGSAFGILPTLERLMEGLDEGRGVLAHCRGGIGRSSLLAAATLVALGEGPERAWARIEAARGRPVPDTEAQRRWIFDFAELIQVFEDPRKKKRPLREGIGNLSAPT